MILPSREAELLHHYLDYLEQITVLNNLVQRHFASINAGNYEGTSKQQYEKQLDEVRQAHKRLLEHRKSLRSEEQEGSPFPLVIAAGSSN